MGDFKQYVDDPKMAEFVARNPTPIYPFLRLRNGATGDKAAGEKLDAIVAGFFPNQIDWCKKFGTKAPLLLNVPIDGVFLSGKE